VEIAKKLYQAYAPNIHYNPDKVFPALSEFLFMEILENGGKTNLYQLMVMS